MTQTSSQLDAFYATLRRLYTLRTVEGLLDWDQQVCLPSSAGGHRAGQLTALASLIHTEQTSEMFAQTTRALASQDISEEDAVNVRETLRTIERARKIPTRLVEEKAKTIAETYQAWVQIRPTGNFKNIQEKFTHLVSLVREEASCTAVSDNPYDALLDIYEPGGRVAVVGPLLQSCADSIAEILPAITKQQGKHVVADGPFPAEQQEKLTRSIAGALGFSFTAGRLDTAPHPFQTTLGPNDFRITTRFDEAEPFSALYGVIHEVGHALYEMGLQKQWMGTPMGSAVSLGIHESQSRFWENMVGRSRPFCSYLARVMGEFFPTKRQSPDDLWSIVNRVEPSLIRVEADEVTYTLHVVIRMQLEELLINDRLPISELPDAWRQLYRKYLGIEAPNDRDGVLQDVHWYSGSFGYFPTYALGNLYAAMFRETMHTHLGDTDALVDAGEVSPILSWLNSNIHSHGMRFRGAELVQHVTGKALSAEAFLRYLEGKYLAA